MTVRDPEERIAELLEAANRYLERARAAEAVAAMYKLIANRALNVAERLTADCAAVTVGFDPAEGPDATGYAISEGSRIIAVGRYEDRRCPTCDSFTLRRELNRPDCLRCDTCDGLVQQ